MKTYTPFCVPQDEFERRLVVHEIFTQSDEITFLDPPIECQLCGASFANRRFMFDTCLDINRNLWGCVCAKCYINYALEIGWEGQLYTHLKSGEWLLTAGNRPSNC